jgi:ankyrin repeat protein
MLENGADIQLRSKGERKTALHFAAEGGIPACCELLLATVDARLEARDALGFTPLMLAAETGAVDSVKLLLQHGADVNAANADGVTPLILASLRQRVDVVVLLLTTGADVNTLESRGRSALTAAVHTGNTALVQLLLEHNANIQLTDSAGENALMKAALEGHVSMMELLVQRGLSVTAVDKTGNTALMVAVSTGQKEAVEWLLQHGAAADTLNDAGFTALYLACGAGSGDNAVIMELLLQHSADANKCANKLTGTALGMAAYYGNVECARALIAAGVDVNCADIKGQMSLHMVGMPGQNAALLQLLLDSGATAIMNKVVPLVCTQGAQCCTHVTVLMQCTTADTVKVLLAAGADVHVTTAAGDTCLHVAARHNYRAPVLCLLIKAGADLHAVNKAGKTAAQLAHDKGHTLTAQLLNRAAQQA